MWYEHIISFFFVLLKHKFSTKNISTILYKEIKFTAVRCYFWPFYTPIVHVPLTLQQSLASWINASTDTWFNELPMQRWKEMKEWNIVHFYCSAPGTGKSLNPHHFKHVKNLPCEYWPLHPPPLLTPVRITQNLFEEWLLDIEEKMNLEQWNILILLDHCVAHNLIPQIFSLNCTLALQPLNVEIIPAFRVHYLKLLLKKIMLILEHSDDINTDFFKWAQKSLISVK